MSGLLCYNRTEIIWVDYLYEEGKKMLELPECQTIAKQITQTLKGKIISEVKVLHTSHKFAFFQGEIKQYSDMLEGQTILEAVSYGGIIEINTEEYMIAFHDGAYPRYYEEKKKFPQNHQFAMYFDDETAVFVSIQMYGGIIVFPLGSCKDSYYLSALTKPNPLSAEFTFEYFRSLYDPEGKKLSAKAFLATQQRIPGLGNGVLQDILWEAGIDPRFDIKNCTEQDFRTLYQSIRKVLMDMTTNCGRDTERDLFGNKGGYITQLSKTTLHQPCIHCGYEIHKANYLGGTIYFCEHCQRR